MNRRSFAPCWLVVCLVLLMTSVSGSPVLAGLDRAPSRQAAEPPPDILQVDAGLGHTCVLKDNGSLACWGDNYFGQSTVPAPNSGFTQVGAGGYHTCGLKNDGSVACWGYYDDLPAPNSGFTQVSAGGFHTCGLKNDSSIACWGDNYYGQSTVPPPNSGFTQVDAGWDHTCGLKEDGSVACWGGNSHNQNTVPPPNSGFTQVSAGSSHTCGLKEDGSIACWGSNTWDMATVPPPNSGFSQVSAGDAHTCGLKEDGSLVCWGYPLDGQTTVPAPNSGFTQLSAGDANTCAVNANGVRCWGSNYFGHSPVITLAPSPLPAGTYGAAYSQAVTAGGGTLATPSYYFDLWSGSLPPGLELDPAGLLRGAPTQAGSYVFSLRARDNNGYIGAQQYTFSVAKATPTVTLGLASTSATYTGAPQAAEVLVAPGSTPGAIGTILYDGSEIQPTDAARYSVTVSFTPTDQDNYLSLEKYPAGHFTIHKAVPTVTLSLASTTATYTGAPLAAGVLVAPSSTPGATGNIRYNGSTTQPTNAGAYTITASFIPTDTTNYETLENLPVGVFTIQKATPTATLSLASTSATYTGAPHTANVLIAASSTPGATGNIRYNGSATPPVNAGTYAVTASFTPTDAANYQTLENQPVGVFTIQKAPLTVSAANLSRLVVQANPPLTYTFSGFVNGENAASAGVTGTPEIATIAVQGSPPGDYPITISAGSLFALNYDFTHFEGATLTVEAWSYLFLPLVSH
jgi:hypothetical protein